MSTIVVVMKRCGDSPIAERRVFEHEGRAGGSYTKTLTLEGGCAIIEDEWGKRTIIPLENIDFIEERPNRV